MFLETELRSQRATCCEQRLTLKGLQEQLVVGLDELQVGLLGSSHRGGARLVQAVGFPTSRAHTRRMASPRGAGSVWSHQPPWGEKRSRRLSHLVRGLVRFNIKTETRERKSAPLSLSTQKSGVCSQLGGAPPPAHFKSNIAGYSPLRVSTSTKPLDSWFRQGVSSGFREVGVQPQNARIELSAPGKLTRLASLPG